MSSSQLTPLTTRSLRLAAISCVSFFVGALVVMRTAGGDDRGVQPYLVLVLACTAFISSVAAVIYWSVAKELRGSAPAARVGRRSSRLRDNVPVWLALVGLVGSFLLLPFGC
mgnify:CR=1 FL=1